jgi:hypothetical protein
MSEAIGAWYFGGAGHMSPARTMDAAARQNIVNAART